LAARLDLEECHRGVCHGWTIEVLDGDEDGFVVSDDCDWIVDEGCSPAIPVGLRNSA
jgi:hypothetical protein